MQLDRTETAGRQQEIAAQLLSDFHPGTVQVLYDDALADELTALGVDTDVQANCDMTVVADGSPQIGWAPTSDIVLVLAGKAALPAWAAALAEHGYYRDFGWAQRGCLLGSALFRASISAGAELVDGYEQELAALRRSLLQAEKAGSASQKTIDNQRQELALARAHESKLETTLNEVTGSTCWKMTWPLRYIISKTKSILRVLPFYAVLSAFYHGGPAGIKLYNAKQKYYPARFPGKALAPERLAPVELLIRQAQNQPDGGPLISIVVPLYNTPVEFLEQLLDSVVNQTYDNWELCCVDAGQEEAAGQVVRRRMEQDSRIRYQKLDANEGIAGNTNRGFAMAKGEFIALLDHDDLLHPCALWYAAQAVCAQGADFIYTDEATFETDPEKPILYHFKPDFMQDNLRSNNYICHLTVFRRSLLDTAGGGERSEYDGSQDYDLFLRLTEKAEKIVHIPHALYYWRASANSTAGDISAKAYCLDAAVRALYAHYERTGIPVDNVSLIPDTPGCYKTDYTITRPGKVSILIPSCDHYRDLTTCVESIYAKTTYANFEIIIIENNSTEPRTFRCYEQLQKAHPDNLRVVKWEGTGFNYSALNNFGLQYAQGEYLLLLNNDTEVIAPRWLEEMVMYAQQKRVGCVGAKLLYPDDTVQHAGVGFGIGGVAGHLHKYFQADAPGYMWRMAYVQDVYAVTAACLLVRREVYEEVGGLDESFAVAFNDVDFCCKVRKAGYENVYTPFAQLYHYESKSRGLDESPEKKQRFSSEVTRFKARWKKELEEGDPCMNPNFSLDREDFCINVQPLE